MLTEIILWLFFITNTLRIAAYLPQIISAWKCDTGAKSVSMMTWGFFMFSHLTSMLYGFVVIEDDKMAYVFLGNFLASGALFGILVYKRIHYLGTKDRTPNDASFSVETSI